MTQFVVFRSHLGVVGGTLELHVPSTDAIVAAAPAQELTPDGGIYQAGFDGVAVDDYLLKHINASGKPQWIDTVRVSSASGTFLSFDVTGASGGDVDLTPVLDKLPETGRALNDADTRSAIADQIYDWGSDQGFTDLFTSEVIALLNDIPNNAEFNGRTLAAAAYATISNQTTLMTRLSATRAGYLDNLNVTGVVASQADINAINQSASRRVILQTVGQWERPESGSTVYVIELRTFDGDGASVDADTTPNLSVAGTVSGSLATNLSAQTNPATGVYRWNYTVSSNATIEPVRCDASATIDGSDFPMSVYTQVTDFTSVDFTSSDRTKLDAIFNKLPSRAFLSGTTSANGAVLPADLGLAAANLDSQLTTISTNATAAKTAAESVDGKLTAPRLAKIDGAAQTGADNDTLKSLSDQLDGVNSTASTIAAGVANVLLKFTGMTSLADWIRRIVRKDAGTVAMAAAQSEIGSGGTSTFDGTQHSLEAMATATSSNGATSEFTGDALAQITELRGLIQNSEGATLLTTVRPGGKLALKAGDDYVASETYTVDVPIDDPSESAYLLLTRSQTQSIKFGASRRNSNKSDQIVGTAQKAAVYKNAGKTFVPVEISGQILTNLRVGDNWLYDIQVTSEAGKKRTVCSGPMEIEQDNAT